MTQDKDGTKMTEYEDIGEKLKWKEIMYKICRRKNRN